MLDFTRHEKQCEHLCVVGICKGTPLNLQDGFKFFRVYDGQEHTFDFDNYEYSIETFNFCPRCGQELTVIITHNDKTFKLVAKKG